MIRILLNGRDVSPHADWPKTQVVVQKDLENLTIAVQLQEVILHSDAYDYIKSVEASLPVIVCEVYIDSVAFKGRILQHNIRYFRDFCKVSVDLDTAGDFARLVAGRLVPASVVESFPVVVRPRVDRVTVVMLIISIFVITYIIVKESYELAREVAILLGIAGAGVTGPVSSSIASAALAVLRALYIAALVVALVNLVREVINLLMRIEQTKAFRLLDALQAIAQQAGYTLQAPAWLRDVWVVGDTADLNEATELFMIAKQLTRSVLLGVGTQLRLVPVGGTLPTALRQAWEEGYRYNTEEIPRRELITLVRDAADSWSITAPAAVEVDRPGLLGYRRVDMAKATGRNAGEHAHKGLILAFLNVLSVFSRRIRNIRAQWQDSEGYLIVEREGFAEKLVYAQRKTQVEQRKLLERVQAHYANRRLEKRYEDVRIPLTVQDFQTLLAQGFPGVVSLRWLPVEGWAEVTYSVETKTLQETIRIV